MCLLSILALFIYYRQKHNNTVIFLALLAPLAASHVLAVISMMTAAHMQSGRWLTWVKKRNSKVLKCYRCVVMKFESRKTSLSHSCFQALWCTTWKISPGIFHLDPSCKTWRFHFHCTNIDPPTALEAHSRRISFTLFYLNFKLGFFDPFHWLQLLSVHLSTELLCLESPHLFVSHCWILDSFPQFSPTIFISMCLIFFPLTRSGVSSSPTAVSFCTTL